MTKEEFIKEIASYVEKYREQFGIKVCSPIIAQACLESGFGTSNKAKHHNYFGLKYRPNRVSCNNGYFNDGGSEQKSDGSYTPIQTDWYSFENMEKGVLGYFQFTNTKNYSNLKGVKDPLKYLNNIKADGYATSIDYVKNVYNVITSYNLTQYDKEDIIIIKPEDTVSGYSNSPLVSYINLTKHHGGERTHKIDTITIHCIVGQWTAKQGCDYFARTDRNASCNYVVGKDGDIGLCVEEKNCSWCSSSSQKNGGNDQRAITIETSSDTTHPYTITDAALNALILLCADICKRNGIPALKFSYDKNERVNHLNGVNMTCHRDFAKKACPGDYIYNKEEYIAQEVNKMLNNNLLEIKPVTQPIQNTEDINKFNYIKYSDDYADLKKAFGYDKQKLWNHYQTYGRKEGRKVYFNFECKNGYLVQVKIKDLNIRESHTVNSRSKGFIKPGIYTIVEEKNGFGKLKSGAGWISLKYTERL